jgi:micrococcal nuclease|tara:strand:- start:585 stop:950 length:366 start_codon:yes stop_codon:yes gene_type:complete
MSNATPYAYNAYVVSVYDGDTITVILDMGMGVQKKAKCRLYGIDTPEIRGKTVREKTAAKVARDRVRELVNEKTVLIQSLTKPDKYGRLLVKVWINDIYINDLLIEEGLARAYDGGKKSPW